MQTIPTMTRLRPDLRKLVEDFAKQKDWKISYAVSKMVEYYLLDKNKEVA